MTSQPERPSKKSLQALPHNGMIVNQQYANCHAVSVPRGETDQTIRHILPQPDVIACPMTEFQHHWIASM